MMSLAPGSFLSGVAAVVVVLAFCFAIYGIVWRIGTRAQDRRRPPLGDWRSHPAHRREP